MDSMSSAPAQRARISTFATLTSFIVTSEFLVAALDDGKVHVFSGHGDPLRVFSLSRPARSLLVINKSELVVGCTAGLIELWNLNQGVKNWSITAHRDSIICLASLGTDMVVSGSRDCTLKVWNTVDGNCLRTLTGHTDVVRAFATQNRSVFSASYDQTCRSWNTDSGSCSHIFSGHAAKIRCIALEGKTLVSGDFDGEVRVWNSSSGICEAVLRSHTSIISHITIADGLIVTAGADGRIGAWSPESKQEKWAISKAHPFAINSIQVKDGIILSGGSCDLVRLWRLLDGTLIRETGIQSQAVFKVEFTSVGQNKIVEVFWDDGVVLDFFSI